MSGSGPRNGSMPRRTNSGRRATVSTTPTIMHKSQAGKNVPWISTTGSQPAISKVALATAVYNAEQANTGYRAVSAIPSIEAGRPVATVLLMKGEDLKKITEKLD